MSHLSMILLDWIPNPKYIGHSFKLLLFALIIFSFSLKACFAENPTPTLPNAEVEKRLKSALKEDKKEQKKIFKSLLSPLEYRVTQESGTERPFKNRYWDNKSEGIYVDIISGQPLFSSTHKFKSGTGWPSFYQSLNQEEVYEVEDRSHRTVRVEIRSKTADSHLGHLFNDGPNPTGMRYCINSASLRFIPREKMEESGYGEWMESSGFQSDKSNLKRSNKMKKLVIKPWNQSKNTINQNNKANTLEKRKKLIIKKRSQAQE